MNVESVKKLMKDPIGVGLYFAFEKWRTKDGRRILSTNLYKKVAKRINRQKYARYQSFRNAFLKKFMEENRFDFPEEFMEDGWNTYDSSYFPFTNDVVAAGRKIYEEKGPDSSRVFMPYPIAYYDELLSIDAFKKFAFSKKLIAHAAKYLGEYPVLTNIDLVRSDPRESTEWLESQQLHLDVIDTKIFRVIVYITAVDKENGPFTFYPISVSEKIKKDRYIRYGSALSSMNIDDSKLTEYESEECVEVLGESGSLLTVDGCNCFHFGSRVKSQSRCVLMLSFTSPALENLRERVQLDLVPEYTDEPDYIRLTKEKEFIPTSLLSGS